MMPKRPCFSHCALASVAVLSIGAALFPAKAAAQSDDDLGPRARLSVGQQVALDDGNVIGITPIDLSLQSGTRGQALNFSLSAPLRQGDPADDEFIGLGDVQTRLLYRRFVRSASFETELSYRESDLDRLVFFDDLDNSLVTLDGGRRADSNARMGYVFGSQAKLGGEIALAYGRRDYRGTSDPSLVDAETLQGDARLFLEPTPMIRARILASGLRTDSNGGTDTRSHRAGIGASMQVDKVTNLDLELAQSDIRREDTVTGDIERSDGISVRASVTRTRPDGDYTLSMSSDPGTSGRREAVSLGRSFERPGYELSLSLGLSRLEDNDLDPVFQVNYARNLDAGSQLQASLRRQSVTDIDGNEAINTDLSSSYSRQVTRLSSVGVSLFYRESNVLAGDRQDARRAALDIRYSHLITSDFSVVAGLNMTRARDASGTRDDNERVYLGLSRSFDFLP